MRDNAHQPTMVTKVLAVIVSAVMNAHQSCVSVARTSRVPWANGAKPGTTPTMFAEPPM